MSKNLPALQQKAITLRDYLGSEAIRGPLSDALPKWLSIDRLLRIVFTSTMKNPQLLDCTKESLLQSIMQCAQLGLEPILGRAYLIPYNNSKQINGKWVKVLECQFQPGYQGLVDLARRSGEVKDVFAMVVYENDDFELEYGTNRRLVHKPYLGETPGEPIGAYTVWELSDGTKTFEFMPLHEIYKRRDKSQAYQYAISNPSNKKAQECPWVQWPEEQMKKTVVKHHAKLQPASIEIMQAVELDDSATLGRSQLGMFTQDPDYTALMAPEPETYDTTEFDKHVGKHLDTPDATLDKFLGLTAQAQAVSVDQLKVAAGKQFDAFWKAFEAWRKKEYPDPGTTETQEPDTTDTVDHPWEKGKWWSMRSGSPDKGTGFAAYCQKHSDTFFLAPLDIQGMVGAKWEALYPNVPFPFVKPETPEPPEETDVDKDTTGQETDPGDYEPPGNSPEVKTAVRLLCPETNIEKYPDVCKNKCPYRETCRTYLEYEAEGEAKERSEMIRTLNGMSEEIQVEAFRRCNIEKTQIKSTLPAETLRSVLTMAYVVEEEFKM